MKKGSKGGSEAGLRHFMAPWRNFSVCHWVRKHVDLGKPPFDSGPLFPIYPKGKTARSLLSGVLLELYIKDHGVSGHCGDENQRSTQPEMKTHRKAFSNRCNLSQFCHPQLQSYKPSFCLQRKRKTTLLVQYRFTTRAGKMLAC